MGVTTITRLDHSDQGANEMGWGRLRNYFQNTNLIKVAHNLKFELSFNYVHGIEAPEDTVFHDTMIMSRMLRSDAPSHRLDALCELYCNDTDMTKDWSRLDKEVDQIFKTTKSYQKIPVHIMDKYQAADGQRTILLFHLFYSEMVKDKELYECYLNEIEVIKVTQRLESLGIKFSYYHSRRLIKWMENELDKIQSEVYALFGEWINLNSDQEISRILYKKLDMPIVALTQTGNPAVDKDVIFYLQKEKDHPILDLILRQRSYTKGISIIKGYEEATSKEGIVHPNINTNHALTGRMTSSNPNLQNVSKRKGLKNPYPVPARQCFIPRAGNLLFMVDYSGIEMRLAVQCTGSERLIKLLNENFDFHAACAESFFGDRYTKEKDIEIKKMLRSAAKNARFAMLYGGGIKAVANTLLLSVKEAKYGKDKDRDQFPELYDLMDDCSDFAKEHGYIKTIFGRKLYVPKGKTYIATDYKIQGSAAEVFKRGEVAVDKLLREKYPDIRLLVPVHDELVGEVPRKYMKDLRSIFTEISEKMTSIDKITIPLTVEWSISTTTWNNKKEFKID